MCPGQLAFTLANREDSSTFDLTEEEAKRAGFRQVLVEVETLNEIVRSSGLPPDLVKIDAEGLDLRVLAGASELFAHTEIFLVEVNIRDAHKENTPETVIKFMNEKEFRLIEITDINRSPKTWSAMALRAGFPEEQQHIVEFSRILRIDS